MSLTYCKQIPSCCAVATWHMMNKLLTPCFFFCVSARLLPEKLTVYTTLVGLLNARNYNFGGEFVEAMIRQLKECLKVNMYNEAVHLVSCFFIYLSFYIFPHPFFLPSFHVFCSRTPFYVYYSLSWHQHMVHCRYTKRKRLLTWEVFPSKGEKSHIKVAKLTSNCVFSRWQINLQ